MLDARTARILAKENEEDIEARRRREMVERCEKNIEKAVNEGRLDAVLFVGGQGGWVRADLLRPIGPCGFSLRGICPVPLQVIRNRLAGR